ncbi:NAD-dependent succinate-semialdehyde dehydrogenase [Nocardioides sp. IC4_145]|uniref:NAD-dependent succinate-semialdehyde dehydrogenase n=1 Tax=Nocardioides sp. IC4_145 TaxID=2714037 RepID=UPI00140DE577|nr:NAD-dependent succinate-semialdehyde dehydrogenase [Nocardioides sp. IC4_145]NHC24322.1 NAD-dependent succinate-semialdehyde dehydrogenase [Nocardioides sp. IC4_145]
MSTSTTPAPNADALSRLVGLDPARGVLVGGACRKTSRTFDVENPATGEVVAQVSDGGGTEATAAVDAAAHAWGAWRSLAPRARSQVLRRAHELMLRDTDRLAWLLMTENGKPEADARTEVTYAAEFFRWYAEEAVRHDGSWGEAPAGGTRSIVTHHPVGVAALVTPWNFPAAMITRKVAPALAAGCTVVVKPAEETPLTALALARLLEEAGAPPGALNVVPTTDAPGVVSTWLEDERVRAISFTGSTRVGKVLLRQAADRVVVSSMELGGNAPFVVTANADLEAAVAGAMVAKFRNGGQACTAANRFLVHSAVAAEFTSRLGAAVEAMRVGPAHTPGGVDVGPLITAAQAARVERLVEDAVAHGARVAHRAALPQDSRGHFVAPTVLADVSAGSSIVAEEIFGPIAPVVTWDDEDDVVALANASEYGLAAYVFAGDLRQALRLGEAIDAGMVGINRGVVSDPSAPFGGVKQSGLGREGSREGLHEFTETKFLSLDWPSSG